MTETMETPETETVEERAAYLARLEVIRERRRKRNDLFDKDPSRWTADELQEVLTERYREPTIPPCSVCGKPLSLQSTGGGKPPVWACADRDAYDYSSREGRDAFYEHYARSRYEDVRHGGDDLVMELLWRAALWETMARRLAVVLDQDDLHGGHEASENLAGAVARYVALCETFNAAPWPPPLCIECGLPLRERDPRSLSGHPLPCKRCDDVWLWARRAGWTSATYAFGELTGILEAVAHDVPGRHGAFPPAPDGGGNVSGWEGPPEVIGHALGMLMAYRLLWDDKRVRSKSRSKSRGRGSSDVAEASLVPTVVAPLAQPLAPDGTDTLCVGRLLRVTVSVCADRLKAWEKVLALAGAASPDAPKLTGVPVPTPCMCIACPACGAKPRAFCEEGGDA